MTQAKCKTQDIPLDKNNYSSIILWRCDTENWHQSKDEKYSENKRWYNRKIAAKTPSEPSERKRFKHSLWNRIWSFLGRRRRRSHCTAVGYLSLIYSVIRSPHQHQRHNAKARVCNRQDYGNVNILMTTNCVSPLDNCLLDWTYCSLCFGAFFVCFFLVFCVLPTLWRRNGFMS